MSGIIYKSTNKINRMSYIGKTKNLVNRRRCHESNCNDTYFQRAIQKYGKESFEWVILEECDTENELNEMEFHYIKQYNTFVPNGYNLTLGGDGLCNYIVTEDTRKLLSIKAKDSWNKDKIRKEILSKRMKKVWIDNRDEMVKRMKDAQTKKGVKEKKIETTKLLWKREGHKDKVRKKLNKQWVVICPNGEKIITNDLTEWCKKEGVNRYTLYTSKYNDRPSINGYWLKKYEGRNNE